MAVPVALVDDHNRFKTGRCPADELLKCYLLDGATSNMAVDGSVTPVVYKYTVPAGKILLAERMMIYLQDGTNFASEEWAGTGSALTNGVVVSANGATWETWKTNIDLTTCMFDTEGRANFGKATQSISGRWTFSKEVGEPVVMNAGEIFAVTINDNLTTCEYFYAKIGGRLIDI